MHGSIFVLFKRFVESKYDFNAWIELVKKAKTERTTYEMDKIYPDLEIHKLIAAASDLSKLSVSTLQEEFGEALVPNLLLVYNQYINPEWKTLDMLEHAESVMHKAVKKQDPKTSPPLLNVTRVDKDFIVIDYHSKRKMGSLALGIIKGIAKYYHEDKNIEIEAKTKPDSERVQIRVRYLSQ